MSEIQVRPAVRSEYDAVTQIYGRAFQLDPVYVWLLPDPDVRRARLAGLIGTVVRHMYRDTGVLDVAVRDGRIVGAALWGRPGHVATGRWHLARALPGMLRATRDRMPALVELGSTLEAARPATPHWYLSHLAADPDGQGSGIGSALLSTGVARVDADGVPAYLECKPELVGYYARSRFADTGTVEIDGGALSVVAMLR